MADLLTVVAVTLGIISLIGFLNEKLFHLNTEIALMLFSVLVGFCITLIIAVVKDQSVKELLENLQVYNVEAFLMKGVLCFMLFAGSCHLKLSLFKKHARAIFVLAFVVTLLGAIFYGLLFLGVSSLFSLSFTIPICLMFGSIMGPTDPIAATSILNKFGLPKTTGFLMEAESLLNDGVGASLFVVFSEMVATQQRGGFLSTMIKEIGGAVILGGVVTFLSFLFLKNSRDRNQQIIISLFAVSASYCFSDKLDCSGPIAAVVCGVLFSTLREREEEKGHHMDLEDFDKFWGTLDALLNCMLYAILGLSFVSILKMPYVIGLSLAAIACNLIARAGSLFVGTWMMGPLPDGYDKKRFISLFTWGGLRGGLSIALAVSTASMISHDTYVIILGCTYAVVFFTTVVQGLTMKKVFQKLSR